MHFVLSRVLKSLRCTISVAAGIFAYPLAVINSFIDLSQVKTELAFEYKMHSAWIEIVNEEIRTQTTIYLSTCIVEAVKKI